jgi:6-phosphofructokinase 1
MKKLAVMTSGGDAPGMNAATRAVVRSAVARGCEVAGIRHGYTGLIGGELFALGPRDVGGIIHLGGTMLGTTRCEALRSPDGRTAALATLRRHGIDALVIIGGNGSQTGAFELTQLGAPVIGIASTIDNDLAGCDVTIGATTAIDVALENIDRLRVTAAAMHRAILVEVMGRHCGHLALVAGIAGGAEAILIPEAPVDAESVAAELQAVYARGKSHAIVVVAEGATYNADALAAHFTQHRSRLGFDVRVTRLGHIQRGGTPGTFDRMLGTQLGAAAVEEALAGRFGVLLGQCEGRIVPIPLRDVAGRTRPADLGLLELARVLAQ